MALRKVVGKISPEERDEIQKIFEHRSGLRELAQILNPDNVELYDRLVDDLGRTNTKFQAWWDRMGKKYQWQKTENSNWIVDFDTREIFLVTE